MEKLSQYLNEFKLFRLFSELKQKFRGNRVENFLITFEDFLGCETFFKFCGLPLLGRVDIGRSRKFFGFALAIISLFALESMISIGVYWSDGGNFLIIVENLGYCAVSILTLSKSFWCIFYNRKSIKEVIIKLDEHFPHHSFQQQNCNTRKHLRGLRLISWFTGISYVGGVAHFLTFTFQHQLYCLVTSQACEMQLVMVHWFPFDVWYPFPFVVTFLWYAYVVLIGVSLLLFTDLLFAGLMVILSMEFDILATKISEAEDMSDLKKAIKMHQDLIEITGKMEEVFSPILLVNIILITTALCITAFLALRDLSGVFICKFLPCIFAVLFHGFNPCYFGQKLTNASESVFFATYSMAWNEMDSSLTKMMRIVMTVAQKGQVLTALGFFDMSMETFYWILDTAYSYYSVLMGLYALSH